MTSPRVCLLAVLALFVLAFSDAQSVGNCSSWSYRNLNGSLPATDYAVPNVFWLLTGDALLGADYSLIRSPAPGSVVGPYVQIRESECYWNKTATVNSWSCHLLAYSDAAFTQLIGDIMLVSSDLAFAADGSNGLSGTASATFVMDSSYAATIDPLYRRNFESKANAVYQILLGESRYWQTPVSNISDPAYFQMVGREQVDTSNVTANSTVYGSAFNLLAWTKCDSSQVAPPPPPPPPPPTNQSNETSAFDCDKFYVTQLNLDTASYCSGQDCTINSLYISDQSPAVNDSSSHWRMAAGSMIGPFIRIVEDQCVWTPGSDFKCDFALYKDANYVNSIGKGRMRSFDLSFVDMASNMTRALNGSLEFIYSIDAPIVRVAAGQPAQTKLLWQDFGELFNVLSAADAQLSNYGLMLGGAVNGTSEPKLYIVSSSDISTNNASAAKAAFALRAALVCADLGVAVENCTRFLVQDAENSADACDDNAFYLQSSVAANGSCAIQSASGPWMKLEQGNNCYWDKATSNFACPIGIYLDRARTRLIGTGILSSNNLAFDAQGVVTGDIFVQAAYDGKLIILDMNNSSDASFFANFVDRRSFFLQSLGPSQVFTENNLLYNGGGLKDDDLWIAIKAASLIQGVTDRYTVINFVARLECPKAIPAIPPCDAFRMLALPHHSVNSPYELVPNVLYFPEDPRANLSAGDVNAFPLDSSFPLQQLPNNASNVALYFAIDSQRGCTWRKIGEIQCWLWLYDDRLMFQPFAYASLISSDFQVESDGAVFGNFLLSTFPIEGVTMKEMMWNFNNITNLAISVPRLELLNNTSRTQALASRFSVFPILDKTADDSVFPNMYLTFLGEGFLPADRIIGAQNPNATAARFWINFRAIVSCLAPVVPDCPVLSVDVAEMFSDNYFYLIDADIVLMNSPDRDNMLRAPNREALVGPWFHFDGLKGCSWNVNKTLSCQAWLYRSGLFLESDRIGSAMISSPGLMRMGSDVRGSLVVSKNFTAPYVVANWEGGADVGFSDRNFMPLLNKSYTVPANANVTVDGQLVANRVIRSTDANATESLLLSIIGYDASAMAETSAFHLRALLRCADVNGTVNGTCQRYDLMNWAADASAVSPLAWNYLYVPGMFLGDYFAGTSRDLSVLRGRPAGPWFSLKMGDDCFWIPSTGEFSCGFDIFSSAARDQIIGEGRMRSASLLWRADAVDSVDGAIWITTSYPNSVIVLPFAANDSRVANYVNEEDVVYTVNVPAADRSGLVSKLHYGRVLERAQANANYSTSVFDSYTSLIDLYLWGAQSNDSITNATEYASAFSLHSRVVCGSAQELYRCGRFYIRAANNSVEKLFGLLPRSLDYNGFYSLVNSTQLPYNLTLPDIRNTSLPEADWWRTFFYNTSLPDRYRLPFWPFNFNISLPTWPYPSNIRLPDFPIPGIDYFNPAWGSIIPNPPVPGGNVTLPGNVTVPIPNIPGGIPGLPSTPNGSVSLPNLPSLPGEINIPGLPTIPIPDINLPNLTDPTLPNLPSITRSLFPYIVNGQIRWDLLPVGPIFQLQEGEDCYWEPEQGNFHCPITLFGDQAMSIPIGTGLLSADGAFGLLNDALNSIGGVLNVTFKYNLEMPVGTPEEIRRLFQDQNNVQYVFLPPTIADFNSGLQPVLNRVIDWRNTTSSIGLNLTGDVTRDINDLYVTGIGYAPFLQSGLNTNWQLVCDTIGRVPVDM